MDCRHAADHCPHCTDQTAVISSFEVREQYVPPPEEGLVPQPLFILPSEPAVVWTGARRLLLAVLEEAIHTFLKYHDARTIRGKRAFREAQIWFSSKENHWLYAFESVCQHLHLDPDYIRRGLKLKRCQHASAELPLQAHLAREGEALSVPPDTRPAYTSRPNMRRALFSAQEKERTDGTLQVEHLSLYPIAS